MLRSALVGFMTMAFTTGIWAAEVFTHVEYQIDVKANPNDDGLVSTETTTPGQFISVIHSNGKGDAHGMADYGQLGARARLDPDFPTDQVSTASSQSHFQDLITIDGSNTGAIASATFALHVIGTIHQPFYATEGIGYADASASLFAGSDLGG